MIRLVDRCYEEPRRGSSKKNYATGRAISQRKRKRMEEIFGWLKTVGGLRKTRHREVEPVNWMFTFALAAYNLVRMRNLQAANAQG